VNLLGVPLRDWLAEGIGKDGVVGPFIPDEPEDFFVVSLQGGISTSLEGMSDTPGFQIRAIGRQNDYESAELLAQALDIWIMSATMVDIGATRVHCFMRTGGAPDPDPPDNGDRTHFVCNYLARCASAF
jgi:hypothetical protein